MEGIRVHGRGGQGAVVAGELLVVAAFEDNQHGQAFPAFGGERRGAPVEAFIRVDARPIRLRHRVNAPDLIIVLDPSLVRVAGVMRGLHPDGLVVINSDSPPSSLAWTRDASVCCIPATQIALEVLGQPLVNTSMLGAFCAVTGVVSLAAMQKAIHRRFPGRWGEKNSLAAQAGYDWFRQSGAAPVRVVESRAAPTLAPWETSGRLGAPGRPLHFAAVTGPPHRLGVYHRELAVQPTSL